MIFYFQIINSTLKLLKNYKNRKKFKKDMRKDKIVIYLGFNNPIIYKRGVENVILSQSEALSQDIKKYYIFFGEKDEDFFWNDIKCISIKHNLFRFFKLNKLINRLYKNAGCVIHSHNYLMSFFLSRKTDIFTVHDGLFYLSSQTDHKFKNIFKFIEKAVYRKSKLVHFISNFSKKESLYNENNFIIVNNTTPLEQVKLKFEKEFWSSKKIKIFTVRSIEERVNIELLIELAQKNSNFEIKVSGKGPLLEKYRKKIREKKLENIQLMGFLEDERIRQYYNNCDIVTVLAKYGEGFGLPIIEGYLHNKPVFASNISAIPEVIIDRKFLLENTVIDLENKIQNYLKESKNYNFEKYYYDNFGNNVIREKYIKLYRQFFENH